MLEFQSGDGLGELALPSRDLALKRMRDSLPDYQLLQELLKASRMRRPFLAQSYLICRSILA